jgi:hypothetical protein
MWFKKTRHMQLCVIVAVFNPALASIHRIKYLSVVLSLESGAIGALHLPWRPCCSQRHFSTRSRFTGRNSESIAKKWSRVMLCARWVTKFGPARVNQCFLSVE